MQEVTWREVRKIAGSYVHPVNGAIDYFASGEGFGERYHGDPVKVGDVYLFAVSVDKWSQTGRDGREYKVMRMGTSGAVDRFKFGTDRNEGLTFDNEAAVLVALEIATHIQASR